MVIARKIAYNVLVSSVSKIFSTVLALVSIGLITRYLGKDGFGNYATVLAFLSFFASVIDLGLYHISTREISREGADEEKIMGNIFTLRILSALAVFLLSPLIIIVFAYTTAYSRDVLMGIAVVAASLVFSSSYQVLNGVFQKNLAMDKVAVGELLGKVIQVVVVILAVKFNWGFIWVVSSLLFNMIASFLIIFLWSKKYIRFSLKLDFSYWKEFLRESLPVGIGSMVVFVYFKIDTILLSLMKSGADVGIYNAAYKVLENITFFPSMVIGLMLPVMSNTVFSDKNRFLDISNKTFKFFVLMVVPLIVGTLFLAEGIIALIGGGEFAASAQVLRILVFALASIFFGVFFNNILIAANLQKKLMMVWSTAAIFNVVLNLMFIPNFSYLAAAFVSVGTEFLVAAFSGYLVFKEVKYLPQMENFPAIFLSGFLMAGFLFLFRSANFFLLALGSAAVYFVSLWLFRAVKASEITSLISKEGVKKYEEIP